MKVNSVNTQSTNHKGLKISYDAEQRIRNADSSFVSALFKTGKTMENTQYIDILVMKNLSLRIKEKANPFFCIKEPMHLDKLSDKKINIDAVYDGVEDEVHLKGDKINIGIDFDTVEETNAVVTKFKDMHGLQRVSFIAKLIENYFVKIKSEIYPTGGKRDSVVSLLMDKYGDIVV